MKIEIQAVPLQQKPIWLNLYPLYQFEESQWWPCPMNPFGVFDERPDIQTLAQGADWCDRFWESAGWHPLWILADKQIAGLAVVAEKETGYVAAHVDCDLLDFWILPRFRGQGIGKESGRQIFQLFRGDCKIFVLERVTALSFWRRATPELGPFYLKEESDGDGVIFYFRLSPHELADE